MTLPLTEKLKLKRFIQELASHKAPHTEFVTVYVPQGYDLTKIIQHLAQEQGTASNIKSAATRKNVQAALERLIQHLRTIEKTPPNGLAAFSGNVAAGEGKQDLRVWSLEPPLPLKTRIYRCDKNFVTDLLEEMVVEKEVYGLVVLDRRDANLALLKGKTIVPLKRTHSEVPGKTKAGGQCLFPLTEIRTGSTTLLNELKINDQIKSVNFENDQVINSKIIDKWNVKKEEFIEIITEDGTKIISSLDHLFFIKNKKEKPAEELTLSDRLLKIKNKKVFSTKIKSIKKIKKTIELIDLSVKNKNFIANGLIVHNSAARYMRIREGAYKDHFKKIAEYMKEQFLPLGNDLKGIIIGGPGITVHDFLNKDYLTGDIKKKIIGTKDLSYTGEFGLNELVDRSQDILAKEEIASEKEIMQKFFNLLAKNPGKAAYGEKEVLKALDLGAVETVLISESLSEQKLIAFEELAQKTGAELKLISVETREGQQLKDFGMVAAILRFELG